MAGGVYNTQTLLECNNAACFALQRAHTLILSKLEVPDLHLPIVGSLGQVVENLVGKLSTALGILKCPQLMKYDRTQFARFPRLVFGH